MQFHQNSNDDASLFSRGLINKNMKPDVLNLKKRKQLPASDSGLPAPKHKCLEPVVDLEYDLSSTSSMVTDDVHRWADTAVESTQDSNSFPDDTHSANNDVKVDASFANMESNDEASTSWDDSGSGRSRYRFDYVESSVIRDGKSGKKALSHTQDTDWHDLDGLQGCISSEYCLDSIEQTSEALHELLSTSGVDPNIFAISSESCDNEQETQSGKRKPTIDQEFEQYFSTLML